MENKARIVGIIMVVIAIVLYFAFENDGNDFLVGFFGGGGLAILFAGSFGNKKKSA